MVASCPNQTPKFKSPHRVIIASLFQSRANKAEKLRQAAEEKAAQAKEIEKLRQELEEERERNRKLRRQIGELEREKQNLQETPGRLPVDPPHENYHYGLRFMTLAISLARRIGFRPAARALKAFFDWLDIPQKIPDWSTIRRWTQQLGLHEIQAPKEKGDDWIWMADHSNQIGPEKALAMLGIRAKDLPLRGQALRHEHLRVLAVEPGRSWKREDVACVYQRLAKRLGVPRAVVTDGAVELREPAKMLQKEGRETLVLGDLKHWAANEFERLIGKEERFVEFLAQVGRTRSAIQQTELAHLTPPGAKPKARFMNMERTLHWAAVMLWLLEHPEANARRHVTEERLEEKLGWLRSFATEIAAWRQFQDVISQSLTYINKHGLSQGTAQQLRLLIVGSCTHPSTRLLAARLLRFVRQAEQSLKPGERLPLSTEILESSFALYKQLERQHSKGGFTSLLPAFGALLTPVTPQKVKEALTRVQVRDVQAWVKQRLGNTLASKRADLNREFKTAVKRATETTATT